SVYSLSNMFHVATGNEPVSIVHGVVSIRTPLQAYHGRWSLPVRDPVLIIDAITNNSGSAGGLLIHADGSPVGLIGRELRQAQSNAFVNYAVPLDTLKPVIQSMLEGRTVETPAENDGPTPLTDRQLTSQFGLTMLPNVLDRTPAFVDTIRRNSPAAMAGIQRGDLIVLVNDSVVTSVTSLQQLLATFRSGQSLQVTVNRQESLLTLTLIVP
ncbi:MAG: serine protease, partial [Planctomycetaceae bacterium]|nr:serine protease [Planctomycetaceae bacterium]